MAETLARSEDAAAGALRAHARWLARDPLGIRADLRQWSLCGVDLTACVLDEAVLRDVDFTGACLVNASFVRADLRFATFRDADLREANFSGALLDFALLAGARLTGARFAGASLKNAMLDGVSMSWFDHTLLSELLWRAADGDVEHQMVAAFIGRCANFCWDDFACLPPKRRRWIIDQLRPWVQPGDGAPLMVSAPRPTAAFHPPPASQELLDADGR